MIDLDAIEAAAKECVEHEEAADMIFATVRELDEWHNRKCTLYNLYSYAVTPEVILSLISENRVLREVAEAGEAVVENANMQGLSGKAWDKPMVFIIERRGLGNLKESLSLYHALKEKQTEVKE